MLFAKLSPKTFSVSFITKNFLVLGKMPPGKMPQEKCPPENDPPGKIAPPPVPLKKYFVKLLHVMKYLSVENFVNFNFRQS